MSSTTATTVIALYRASETLHAVHGLLIAAGNLEAASSAHEAGEAIARCIGELVVGERREGVQP